MKDYHTLLTSSRFWDRCGIVLTFSPVLFFCLFTYHGFFGFRGNAVHLGGPILCYQTSLIAFIIGAWFSKRAVFFRVLRVVYFLTIDVVLAFVWFAMWHPESVWTASPPVTAIVFCMPFLACAGVIVSVCYGEKNT